jgi:peptidyl-prolyl cis-trans isomerase D
MLRGIKTASSGWIGKSIMAVVMGLLVISFAIWGIGDIFRGFGQSNLAEIGNTTIGIEQFRNFYNDRLSQIGRQMNRSITPDQARALGFDRQILGQLVAETTLDQKAKDLNLGVSDAQISDKITSEPAFQGVNGKFDRARFEYAIRQAGYTEARFVEEQRQIIKRRQLALSLTGELTAPLAAQNAINIFRNEKRTIDVVVLGPEQAGEIAAPTPEVLQKYFEERKASFRAPETRKVTLLSITPEELARWDVISDEDAKAYYEQHKAEFATSERRQVRQLLFKNPGDAAAAADKLAQGTSFDDIVKEAGDKATYADLGLVTKAGIIDPAVADAAFSLKEGEASKPVKGSFGTVIAQAAKVEPASQQSYEQVAQQIKRTIALDRARQKIGDLRDKIEDERAAGSTLVETAKKLNLTATTVEAMDRSGRDATGKPVLNLPKGVDLIGSVFASDVGVDNEPLQMQSSGGWLWYDVTGITPSHERSLDEVKTEVETRWRNDEIASRLKAKADEMLEKLKAGTKLAEVAAAANLSVETVADLQRGQPKPPLSAGALDAVFRTAKGAAATADGSTSTNRVVFVVTDVVDPPLDPKSADAKQIAETLTRGYSDDILGEYVARLEQEIGVEINQSALQQITGGGTASQ